MVINNENDPAPGVLTPAEMTLKPTLNRRASISKNAKPCTKIIRRRAILAPTIWDEKKILGVKAKAILSRRKSKYLSPSFFRDFILHPETDLFYDPS